MHNVFIELKHLIYFLCENTRKKQLLPIDWELLMADPKDLLSLEESPERGHYPPELSIQGIKEFKEVIFKPYRAIYEITGRKVIVHLCVDGRRDMRALLERRLIRW